MSYSALSVANYFVHKSLETGIELTPMKVLKLVYIAHGWHLALYDEPLINETVQAWKYGPVVPSVYGSFRQFGNKQITMTAPIQSGLLDGNKSAFLDRIWDVYKNYNGIELSAITHKPGTPWDIEWNQNNGKLFLGFPMSNDIIKAHYKELGGIE